MKTPQSPAPVAGDEPARPASEQPVEAIGAGREVARMREIAISWRHPSLRQIEGPNDLKIYGGTIADDIDRWADMIAVLSPASPARTPMGEPVAWIERQNDGTRYGEPKRWPPSDRARSYAQEMGRTIEPLYAAASPARTPMGESPEDAELMSMLDDYADRYIGATRGEYMSLEEMLISKARERFAALAAPTPMGGEVEALREALERIAHMRVELTGTPVDSEAANAWAITLDAAADIARQALAASSPSPAQGGIDYSTLADLHTIKDWLHGLSTHPDLEAIVADGGVTAGMVYQQEAREFAGRIGRIIAALSASPQPEAGEASEDDRAQAWLLRHYRQKAEQAGFGSLAEMMHAAAPPSVQPVEGK